MCRNATKSVNAGGKIRYPASDDDFEPLKNVSVDIYLISKEQDGFFNFLRLTSSVSSFFPGGVDAPFGSTLQVGGHFGKTIREKGDNIYYRIYYSPYSSNPDAPFNPASATQINAPLFNKKYILPTYPGDAGAWHTLYLGPHTAEVNGTPAQVYQRPPLYDTALEYMPFPNLMAIWDSTTAKDEQILMSIEVYEKIGEVNGVPQLAPIALESNVDTFEFLPLVTDNRLSAPKINTWETRVATFSPQGFDSGFLPDINPSSEMEVSTVAANGNESLVLEYSVEDGSAYPHLRYYKLRVKYSHSQIEPPPWFEALPRRFLPSIGRC